MVRLLSVGSEFAFLHAAVLLPVVPTRELTFERKQFLVLNNNKIRIWVGRATVAAISRPHPPLEMPPLLLVVVLVHGFQNVHAAVPACNKAYRSGAASCEMTMNIAGHSPRGSFMHGLPNFLQRWHED